MGGEVRGLLQLENHEREQAFNNSDIRLMQTVTNSMSFALENARLFEETTQRAAELAIINKVQEGLAAELDIQAIYDLVGNEIQEIFDAQSIIIQNYDVISDTRQARFLWEKGKRIQSSGPRPLNQLDRNIIKRREVLVFNENAQKSMKALGTEMVSGTEPSLSAVFAPLISGDRVFGYISLQNVDKENAFSESDVRLLTTLANSMSVALENARLFNETQRLLAETEQRNAELAIINTVQQGLVAKADYQGIINLVGDKLREIFKTGDMGVMFYDQKTNLLSYPYLYEHGNRLSLNPSPPGGFGKAILETKQPVIIEDGSEWEAKNPSLIDGTDMAKSAAAVPFFTGDRVTGWFQIENFEKIQAFSDSDVRLMQTLASSMSVALENARLFEETTQRAAELAIINKVQEGLAAEPGR